MNHPPTSVRTFSLHKVRKNFHFLDNPPTPMSLRNIKMAPYGIICISLVLKIEKVFFFYFPWACSLWVMIFTANFWLPNLKFYNPTNLTHITLYNGQNQVYEGFFAEINGNITLWASYCFSMLLICSKRHVPPSSISWIFFTTPRHILSRLVK